MVDAEQRRVLEKKLVDLTRDLILIPSTCSRPSERDTCLNFIRNRLESVPGVSVRLFREGGFPSLVAMPASTTAPDVLLVGHLDVVEHPDLERYESRVEAGRIVGPGAAEMKGPLAILMCLFRALHARYPGISLGLAVTSDEELGGENGVGYLFGAGGVHCDLAIVPDGGSPTEVTVEEKGALHLHLKASGRHGHGAAPWAGENALEKVLSGLARLKEHFSGLKDSDAQWSPTCSITIVRTENESINRIPAVAEAGVDIRFPAPYTAKMMRENVRSILGDEIEVEVELSAEPSQLQPDAGFVQLLRQHTGRKVDLVRAPGGSDARFICRFGIPVIMCRPLVGEIHSVEEWIDIQSMVEFYEVCEAFLSKRLAVSTPT